MKRTRLSAEDRRLGMDRGISRRDFLQGAALGGAGAALGAAGAALLPGFAAADTLSPAGVQDLAGYYPPLLQGLRGRL
jgi:spermidine dehydrogenase